MSSSFCGSFLGRLQSGYHPRDHFGEQKMPFPTQSSVEIPLLQVISSLGGEVNPRDVYKPLAAKFPQLTPADLGEIKGSTGANRWENNVQWVRQKLVEKGELDGSVRGVWKLTVAGRVRLVRGAEAHAEAPLVSPEPVPDLHPLLLEQLSALRAQLVARGDLPSRETLESLYGTFRQRFGPEVLKQHDGEPLLSLMHETKRDSLVYWLEFKDDAEFPAHFGSIAGGSALKYGLYRRKETGAWMTGTPTAQRELSTAEAIALARRNRDQLVAACDILAAFPDRGSDAKYLELQAELTRVAPDVEDSAWGHKYLSLLFPDRLDDFHGADYQRFNLMKLLQLPSAEQGRYVNAGRFVALSDAFGWPMNHLTTVLNRRHGPPHRYWRIGTRAGDTGTSYWEQMREEGFVSIGWDKLGDLGTALAEADFKEEVRARLSNLYPADPRVTGRSAQQITHFSNRVKERDYVLACDGAEVHGIGRVTGPYNFAPGEKFPHRRPVEWLEVADWKLPETEGLRTTVHEYRNHPENLVAIEQRVIEAAPRSESKKAATVMTSAVARKPLQWTGGDTIGRIQDVLNRKGQLILYGPPGTGKTFWAERAALTLAALFNFGASLSELSPTERAKVAENGPDAFVRFCSFHPGYGYEDFIEGFRPHIENGSMQFVRRDGIFKSLCDAAQRDKEHHYYLIIDEINRGDVPRIFGELITLLDKPKRGTSVRLPLSGDALTVPDNVFVIATMNTADRSIALLDAALRRRFGFIELLPDASTLGEAVLQGIPLGPWLSALNRLIAVHVGRDGRNLQIGHSFFLSGERPIQDFSLFARILQEDILPLLEEYCYDDWDALERMLGPGLVDAADRRFRTELFAPNRSAELVQAVLACTPDVNSSAIAVAADASTQSDEVSSEDDAEDGGGS